MVEDWAAVARAISRRMTELGLNQRELIERSRVSKATVGELYHNSAQRRRSARTLEALSIALEWHPQHLVAVLKGQRAPGIGEPKQGSAGMPPKRAPSRSRQARRSRVQLTPLRTGPRQRWTT